MLDKGRDKQTRLNMAESGQRKCPNSDPVMQNSLNFRRIWPLADFGLISGQAVA